MSDAVTHHFDPARDLKLERTVDIAPHRVWAAWTRPEHIIHWFTPAPWTTIAAEIDLRPGSIFKTVMRSPEGQEYPGVGCILEVIENRRFTWTSMLGPGYHPTASGSQPDDLPMTGVIDLAPHGSGTKYTAMALHPDAATCAKHSEMGFHGGWGTALDQLVAYMKRAA